MTKAKLILALALITACTCTPADRQNLGVPTLSQIDAIGSTVAQAIKWCEDHGADPDDVLAAFKAISDKDPGTAAVVVHRILGKLVDKGVPIPSEIVALVQTAEGAMAAQAVQDGMRALSAPSSSTVAPLPSSGL